MTHPTLITAQPGLPFVDIVREFNAPAAAVFRAHTQADLYAQWLGPRSINLDSLELDATAGGRWKYTFNGQGGTEDAFFGVFHTVAPNTLLIQSFQFNLAPGHVGVSSTHFAQADGPPGLPRH